MKQGPYRGRRGRLHRHGRPRRKALNLKRTAATIRRAMTEDKYL